MGNRLPALQIPIKILKLVVSKQCDSAKTTFLCGTAREEVGLVQ